MEVLYSTGPWLVAKPMPGSFVVNFDNAFEAATEGAVKATVHREVAASPDSNVRYSIPFFQGLPLRLTVSRVRGYMSESVRLVERDVTAGKAASTFLDPRRDSLCDSQMRKWIGSHLGVA